MNWSISSGRTSGPLSLISVCSLEVGSTMARLVRDSPPIIVKSLRIDSSVRSSRMRAPVAPPASPVAITGRPRSFRARATLTPLPPATVRDSTARCRRPRRKFGTATVRSIAAFNVTVRITTGPQPPLETFDDDLSGQTAPSAGASAPGERRANQYHDRHHHDTDQPDDDARSRNRVVHVGHRRAFRG